MPASAAAQAVPWKPALPYSNTSALLASPAWQVPPWYPAAWHSCQQFNKLAFYGCISSLTKRIQSCFCFKQGEKARHTVEIHDSTKSNVVAEESRQTPALQTVFNPSPSARFPGSFHSVPPPTFRNLRHLIDTWLQWILHIVLESVPSSTPNLHSAHSKQIWAQTGEPVTCCINTHSRSLHSFYFSYSSTTQGFCFLASSAPKFFKIYIAQ